MITPVSLPQPFIPLNSSKATLENTGGKGLNLTKLVQAGFPVPNGFLIPTLVYQEFVAYNGLSPHIRAALQGLDAASAGELAAASETIRSLFTSGRMPPGLASPLEIGWRWLGAGPVAVRSSATAEDLPDLSFAGQQDTYLNIIGADALEDAVVRCWASLWTARAIGYRARNSIPHDDVALAVVVQKMVQSQASGVLFTANPLNGLRSETVIDATLGLGEALVGGQVEPDHYVVRFGMDGSGELLRKSLGSKALVIRGKSEGGVISHEIDHANQQALPDETILQLAKMGRKIEAVYDFPQDIEWAYFPPDEVDDAHVEHDGLFVLQSRPITSLFPLPEGMTPEPLKAMMGIHAVQGVVEPLTPLGQDMLKLILTRAGRLFDMEYTIETQTAFYSAAERIWINMTSILRHPVGHRIAPRLIKSIDPGVARAFTDLTGDERLAPGKSRPGLKFLLRIGKFLLPVIFWVGKAFRSPDRQRQKVNELFDTQIAEIQSLVRVHGDVWADYSQRIGLIREVQDIFYKLAIPRGVPLVAAGMATFFGILERFAKQAAEATGEARYQTIHMEIARGLPHNVTTEMDLALWKTAQNIRLHPAAAEIFESSPANDLAVGFLAGTLPAAAQDAVVGFLERYGMRGLGEIDLGRPRWREDPTHVMHVLQSYLQIDDPQQAPDMVFARGAEAARQAADLLVDEVLKLPYGRIKARLVRFGVSRYRAIAGMREAPKFFAIRMMGILRRELLQSGKELADAGLLAQADDLFFLSISELEATAAEGQITDQIRASIQQRRETRQREMLRKQIPRVLLSDGRAYYEGVAAPVDDSEVILGDPVSPGVVEGTVRVVFDPQRTQLEPGEILVCPGTDPAWTPLFLTAGGLVMEVGGMMTHGSVVAREYGIPAVVGVHQATTRLHTGQVIRVDGSTGAISVIGEE